MTTSNLSLDLVTALACHDEPLSAEGALEPAILENKYYCPGIGVALEQDIQGSTDRNELVTVIGP